MDAGLLSGIGEGLKNFSQSYSAARKERTEEEKVKQAQMVAQAKLLQEQNDKVDKDKWNDINLEVKGYKRNPDGSITKTQAALDKEKTEGERFAASHGMVPVNASTPQPNPTTPSTNLDDNAQPADGLNSSNPETHFASSDAFLNKLSPEAKGLMPQGMMPKGLMEQRPAPITQASTPSPKIPTQPSGGGSRTYTIGGTTYQSDPNKVSDREKYNLQQERNGRMKTNTEHTINTDYVKDPLLIKYSTIATRAANALDILQNSEYTPAQLASELGTTFNSTIGMGASTSSAADREAAHELKSAFGDVQKHVVGYLGASTKYNALSDDQKQYYREQFQRMSNNINEAMIARAISISNSYTMPEAKGVATRAIQNIAPDYEPGMTYKDLVKKRYNNIGKGKK